MQALAIIGLVLANIARSGAPSLDAPSRRCHPDPMAGGTILLGEFAPHLSHLDVACNRYARVRPVDELTGVRAQMGVDLPVFPGAAARSGLPSRHRGRQPSRSPSCRRLAANSVI